MKLIDKLKELSISIPEVNPALGSYVPYKRVNNLIYICLLYTSPSPRDGLLSRMPSSA